MGIAAIPMAVYPYIYLAIPAVFPSLSTMELNTIMQGILTVLQIWSLLLVSAALCFGKGLRLDKAIVISLTAVYLNMAALFILGRFT
jgi:phage-related minor tail protein